MSSPRTNEFGQPIGVALGDWQPCPFPDVAVLRGRWCQVGPLREDHADHLWDELCGPGNAALWTYSPHGPFDDRPDFVRFVGNRAEDTSSVAVVVVDEDGVACGIANYLAIQQDHGTVEVGGIVLGPRLQRTTAATEAMYLMAQHVFGLGYRRYEWKCDALNEPSRQAALRFGFTYEGRFRNAIVYKHRNRDTDWFSITDQEWPGRAAALEAWLEAGNHVDGVQRRRLESFRD